MANIGMMEGAYFVGRIELLSWVNNLLGENYTKVEQMSSGAAYCQLIDAIYPGKIALHKVCFNARLEYEFIKNWKVLQDAFVKQNIDKLLDIPRLTKSKYQDNLEFMQWMKRYFDMNYSGGCDFQERKRQAIAQSKNPVATVATTTVASISTTTTTTADRVVKDSPPVVTPRKSAGRRVSTLPTRTVQPSKPKENIQPTQPNNDAIALKELQTSMTELRTTAELLEKDRDFYFNKLKEVNTLCQSVNDDCPAEVLNFIAKIQKILYADDDKS